MHFCIQNSVCPSPAPQAPLSAGAFYYDLWISLFDLEDDLVTFTIRKRRETWVQLRLGTEFHSEKIPRNRLGMISVIPRKKALIPRHSEFRGRANSEVRNGTERNEIPTEKISSTKQQQNNLTKWFVCTSKVDFSDTVIDIFGCRVLFCAEILEQFMGARNRVGIGLLYRPARLNRLAESIPWNRFLDSLKV